MKSLEIGFDFILSFSGEKVSSSSNAIPIAIAITIHSDIIISLLLLKPHTLASRAIVHNLMTKDIAINAEMSFTRRTLIPTTLTRTFGSLLMLLLLLHLLQLSIRASRSRHGGKVGQTAKTA
jgi:hypothetical protein